MKERWIPLACVLTPLLLAVTCLTAFQNAGNTGTATVSQNVVYTANTSQIFNNVGQSAHYLSYCPSGGNFTGTVDLEGSFNGSTNWTVIAAASYLVTPLTICRVLQAGGYYQNIRSVVTPVANTITATYNASSGPIGYSPPGIGDGGPSSPTVCNKSLVVVVANGATSVVVPAVANSSIRVCAYQVTAALGYTAGTINFYQSTGTSSCTGLTDLWDMLTISGNQQNFALGTGVGTLFSTPVGYSLCLANTSGSSVDVDVSYTAVYNGF